MLEDLASGRRPSATLAELDAEFRHLGVAWQMTQAVERRLEREGVRRRGPTDEEARRWFGYSGASSSSTDLTKRSETSSLPAMRLTRLRIRHLS